MTARGALALALLLVASPAVAQDAAIELEVGAREARAIDVDALREALARELGVEVRMARQDAPEVPRIRVRTIARARAVLELRRPDGSRMRRSTELDRDPAERLETIVILAVNMVRDEASELLELLRRRRPVEVVAQESVETPVPTELPTEGTVASEGPVAGEGLVAGEGPVAGEGTVVGATPSSDATPAEPVAATTETVVEAPAAVAPVEPSEPAVEEPEPRAPGPRVVRIGLGALAGSVPRGLGHEVNLVGGLEIAWTPTDFLAFGVRDLGGGVLPSSVARWSAGGAVFGEVGWVLDPALVLHLQLGVDIRANVGASQDSAGAAPLVVLGARIFPIRELSIALQTALHVVATDAWSSNLQVLPQGAVMWTGGLSIAAHF